MSDDARQNWIEGRAETASALEADLQAFEQGLEVDPDSLVPDEGVPFEPGQYEREYIGNLNQEQQAAPTTPAETPAQEAAPEGAPAVPVVEPPKQEAAPVTPPAPSPFEAFLKWQQEQESAKAKAAEEAQRRQVEEMAQRAKALRDDPQWRAQVLAKNGMNPADPLHQAHLDQYFQIQDMREEQRASNLALQQLQEQLRTGARMAVAQTEVQRIVGELKAPGPVAQMIEQRVHDLVRAGWSEREAAEYVAEPLRAWAPAAPQPPKAPAPAPKPGPRKLSPEEQRALSVASLQGRGAGKTNLPTDPGARLALARGLLTRRS